jgi:hypothetical protein
VSVNEKKWLVMHMQKLQLYTLVSLTFGAKSDHRFVTKHAPCASGTIPAGAKWHIPSCVCHHRGPLHCDDMGGKALRVPVVASGAEHKQHTRKILSVTRGHGFRQLLGTLSETGPLSAVQPGDPFNMACCYSNNPGTT